MLLACILALCRSPVSNPGLPPVYLLHKQQLLPSSPAHIRRTQRTTMSALATASSMSRACSVSRSGCLDFAVPVVAAPAARPQLQRGGTRSNRLRVCASQQQPKGLVGGLRSSATKFLQVGVVCPNAAVPA
jgi:hypothetical protein